MRSLLPDSLAAILERLRALHCVPRDARFIRIDPFQSALV